MSLTWKCIRHHGQRDRQRCSARKQWPTIKKKHTICSLSPQRPLRIHYIMQNGHSEPYDIAVIESCPPIFLCAWSEVLCYFNELFRLVAGCIWAITTNSMNNCYCLLKARCMEFMQIWRKGKCACLCVFVCVRVSWNNCIPDVPLSCEPHKHTHMQNQHGISICLRS